jgi:hypothetical protein
VDTKLGKRIRGTIRQLGYPTKNALKGWHCEYEQRRAKPKRRRYGLSGGDQFGTREPSSRDFQAVAPNELA